MSQDHEAVAVIGGTGALGSGLALRLVRSGYAVIIGSRNLSRAKEVMDEILRQVPHGSIKALSNRDAAAAADIAVLTVPFTAEKDTVEEIRSSLQGKILVDATAPLVPPRVNRVQLPVDGSAVAGVQAMLGGETRVVSAFQNVSAEKLKGTTSTIDCDVLVCGDDTDARERIISLVQRLGLRGVDAGPICNSVVAEALTSVLIWINRRYKVPGAGIRISGL